ncbi:MAG: aldo/keto reductase [Candidatus Binatia bacterium]
MFISRAALRGIGVVALRVVAAGALSGSGRPHPLNRGGPAESGAWADDARRARALSSLRLHERETLAQVAVRFALTHQQISTVLVGFSEMRHLEEAVACSGRPGFSRSNCTGWTACTRRPLIAKRKMKGSESNSLPVSVYFCMIFFANLLASVTAGERYRAKSDDRPLLHTPISNAVT